jgi:serine/threonine protein phosphatase PrpC
MAAIKQGSLLNIERTEGVMVRLCRAGGKAEAEAEAQDCRFRLTSVVHPLEPGDRFLLYTDGLVEAVNAKGEFFGQDALSAVLRQTAELAPATASQRIISAVQQWSATQDDDLTVLVCDYIPST